MAPKRNISDLRNDGDGKTHSEREEAEEAQEPPHTKLRLSSRSPPPSFHQIQQESPVPTPLPEPKTLTYPPQTPITKQTPFQLPTQVLSFSYSDQHELEFTDSALRYFVGPPLGAKLGYGYDRWVRKPDTRGRIDALLRAIGKAKEDSKKRGMVEGVGVVCWRGVMTRILTAPYEDRDGWEMNVMLVNGTLYFEEHLSDEKLKDKNNMAPRQRLQTYYGYAFESYCTSETQTRRSSSSPSYPDAPFGWSGDVNTNVQWCSVVRTKLGDTRMIIGGEVDCVRGKYTGKTDSFVELKTSMTIRGAQDEARFEKKLLKFYFQSFLLGVPEIFVGFRTPAGVVITTQSFKTMELPRLVRGKPGAWDPLVCLAWGHRFLTFLRDVVQQQGNTPVWRAKFVPGSGATVRRLDEDDVVDVVGGEERVGFLPRWYWEEARTQIAPHAQPSEEHRTHGPPRPMAASASSSGTSTSAVATGWQI
ncbi:RAI1 like PD-XK nuclease-domain-containing protein [Crucibulum laeve]|uniref:Decapping nuclease n=1 Tax=Crucibulum laeve TaxID=68775 RepID=A0A5C3MH15_9AGAR|nr:RAI1 like PD-XK nuclease-domain-containing protein [Crucibulum laeve]